VISFLFWAAVGVCILAQVFIVAGAIRSSGAERADPAVPRPSRAAEIAWTVIPAIALALLFVFTHRALEAAEVDHPSATHSSAEVMR
jgi:heme/copper-type cytochrome/quinol oxidase subunit 2